MVSTRVHAWVQQQVRDIGHAGRVEVVVRKPRLVRGRASLSAADVTPATAQLLARARCTTRLKTDRVRWFRDECSGLNRQGSTVNCE